MKLGYKKALPQKFFSFTPGFSPVTDGKVIAENRFNGFRGFPVIETVKNGFSTKVVSNHRAEARCELERLLGQSRN